MKKLGQLKSPEYLRVLAGHLQQFLQSKIKIHTLKVSFVKTIDTEILDAKLMHSQGGDYNG